MQVRGATRAPGSGRQKIRIPSVCRGLTLVCCQAGPSCLRSQRAQWSSPAGLSARRLLLTGRVCVDGGGALSRAVPPTRVTALGAGAGTRHPGRPFCALTAGARSPPERPTQGRPAPLAFTFQRSCVPSLSPERRRRGGLWAGPGAQKGEEVLQIPQGAVLPLGGGIGVKLFTSGA